MRTFPNQFPQLPIRLQCLILFRKFCIISIFIKWFQTIRTFPCRCLRSEFFSCPNQNTLCFLYGIFYFFIHASVLFSFPSALPNFVLSYFPYLFVIFHHCVYPWYFLHSTSKHSCFAGIYKIVHFLFSSTFVVLSTANFFSSAILLFYFSVISFSSFSQNFRIPFLRFPTYFHCCFLLSMIN